MADEKKLKDQIADVIDSVTLKGIARLSLAAVIPLSIWGLNKLSEMNDAVKTLQTQMTERTGDRYSGTDARRDGQAYLNLIGRNQADIAVLAKRQFLDEKFMYENVIVRRPR